MSIAGLAVGALVETLSARTPTPGGGAAAAVAAAIGIATGLMAARYTTGAKWADRAEAVAALIAKLERLQQAALGHADADVAAYAVLNAAMRRPGGASVDEQQAAAAIPLALLRDCAEAAQAVAEFRPLANPHLLSDVRVAVHLLAGAGRAAHATWLAGAPATPALADPLLGILASAERQVA